MKKKNNIHFLDFFMAKIQKKTFNKLLKIRYFKSILIANPSSCSGHGDAGAFPPTIG